MKKDYLLYASFEQVQIVCNVLMIKQVMDFRAIWTMNACLGFNSSMNCVRRLRVCCRFLDDCHRLSKSVACINEATLVCNTIDGINDNLRRNGMQ